MFDDKLNEVTKEKKKSMNKSTKHRETYGLPFVPSQETLDAMQEADDIMSGKIQVKGYSSFEEMWDDLIGD